MKKLVSVIGLITTLYASSFGQEQISLKDNSYIQLNIHRGNVWAHHAAIKYLVDNHPMGFSLDVGKYAPGNQEWQKPLKKPKYGFGYMYSTLGGKNLGNSHALYSYIDIPFIDKKNFGWRIFLGAGVGYVDNPFGNNENLMNIVNGSSWNGYLKISSSMNVNVLENHSIGCRAGLFHLSNGSTHQPNWGVNVLYVSAYWEAKINAIKQAEVGDEFMKPSPKKRVTLYGGAGFRETVPMDGRYYFVGDVHSTYWHYFSPSFAWGVSISTFYDRSIQKNLWMKENLEEDYIPLDDFEIEGYKYWAPAIGGGLGINLHPAFFSFEAGIYLYTPLGRKIYNRWLLELHVYNGIRIFTGLKSYFGQAEFIESGIAYDLFSKNDKK